MSNLHLKRTKPILLVAGSIIILIVLSEFLGLTMKQDQMIRHYIYHSASSYFDSILITRRWNANYGGVYVEKKGNMQSNKYLEHPDITARNGKVYTMKNPSLMTREISDMSSKNSGFRYHITSLNLLNPGNAPDAWERDALTRFARGEKEATQIISRDGKSWFRLMRPLYYEKGCVGCHGKQGYSPGDVRGGISVSLPYDEVAVELEKNRNKMFRLAAGILLVLGFTFYLIIWKLVDRLSRAGVQLADEKGKLEQLNTELDRRIMERTQELADANDQLRKEILEKDRTHKALMEREEQLRHIQRMEEIGQLASGIAHDFNNIITVIVGYCGILQMKLTPDDFAYDKVAQIAQAADRASKLTKSLLTFSRKESMEPVVLNLNDALRVVESFLKRIIGEGVELTISNRFDPIIIHADQGQIEQVMINLATNAKDAMHGEGKLSFETDIFTVDSAFIAAHGYGEPGPYGLLLVSDTGRGMDKETCDRVFDPFFTTKEAGKGTGLGLSIVQCIIAQHNGFVSVDSHVGVGTTFRVMIPLHGKTAPGLKERLLTAPGGTETILVAEDDEAVSNMVVLALNGYGYRTIQACDGREAVELFKAGKDNIDMLLSDVMMPFLNGVEAARIIKGIKPEVKVLFMSGYAADIVNDKTGDEKDFQLIIKPIHPVRLALKIREILDADSR